MQKSVFITGATGGLGSEACRTFASNNYRVAIGYLNQSEKEKAQQLLAELQGDHHMIVECNIDDTASIQQAKSDIEKHFGSLTALVNNAGWTKFVPSDDLQGLDDNLIDGILTTHIRGYFACVRELEPLFQEGGCIVNISSVAAAVYAGSNIIYCAAKGAVDIMTRSLALALSPKLRVLAVAPGAADTGIVDLTSDLFKEQKDRTPLGRFAQPQDIANTVYSCVEHLPFSTGMTVYADGGRNIG